MICEINFFTFQKCVINICPCGLFRENGYRCFSIDPYTFAMFYGIVPDKSGGRVDKCIFLYMRVTSEPGLHILFNIVSNNGGICPLVAFSRTFPRNMKPVEKYKFINQFVMVGGYLLTINAKGRVAVTFFYIAEYLVVGTVLLNNI